MLDELRRLLRYDAWATSRIRAALGALEPAAFENESGERALALYAHMYGSRRMWLGRIEGTADAALNTWPLLSLADADALRAEMEQRWGALSSGLSEADLGRVVAYATQAGAPGQQTLGDILTHAVLHSMHHRGQIATLVRELGGIPPQNDFVVFTKEEREGAA